MLSLTVTLYLKRPVPSELLKAINRLLSVDPVIKIHLIPLRKLFLFRSISDDLVLTRTFIICRSNDQIDFVPVRIPFVFRSNFDDLVLRRTFTFCRPNDQDPFGSSGNTFYPLDPKLITLI